MMRTNTCGELTKNDIDNSVELCGWVANRRDHGGIIFIDMRDQYGLTQIVFDPSHDKNSHNLAETLRREFVIQIKGKVRSRGEGLSNPKLITGEIEIIVDSLNILSKSDVPPIEIDDRKIASEDMRLKYRYLDLRRPSMQNALKLRHNVVSAARDFFNKNNFMEIETPMLIKSTPEGARDYVVPSRVNPGHFYALPQSPQLYKQILMISGIDKYYQVARALRDEDLRADRQPEHTQFDFEMSFVAQEDIRDFTQNLYKHIFKTVLNIKLDDFPIFSYKESMDKYGTDKPDIRFDLEITDVSEIVKNSDFSVFKNVVEAGGAVKCINPESDMGRKEIDRYILYAQSIGSKGLAWMKVTENGLESNIAKFFSKEIQDELVKKVNAKAGSVMMFIADKPRQAAKIAGDIRLKLAQDLELIKQDEFKFCFVNDFPLFAFNEDSNSWEPEHHMFSMPNKEFIDNFEKNPEIVTGDLWDLVLNGTELGSGSIRISNPEIQERIMNFVGINKEQAYEKFGFLLEAYKYGGPVHGGMGLGVDRTVALMLGTNDIREVIAFPKNKSAACPMDGSPGNIDKKQLKELHIKIDVIKKE